MQSEEGEDARCGDHGAEGDRPDCCFEVLARRRLTEEPDQSERHSGDKRIHAPYRRIGARATSGNWAAVIRLACLAIVAL